MQELNELKNLANKARMDVTITADGGLLLFDCLSERQIEISFDNMQLVLNLLEAREHANSEAEKLGKWS